MLISQALAPVKGRLSARSRSAARAAPPPSTVGRGAAPPPEVSAPVASTPAGFAGAAAPPVAPVEPPPGLVAALEFEVLLVELFDDVEVFVVVDVVGLGLGLVTVTGCFAGFG